MSNRVVEQPRGLEKLHRKIVDEMSRQIYGQREEIMKAFVAKYGFEPDKCTQVEMKSAIGMGNTWAVVGWTDEDISKARQSIISHRLGVEFAHLPWWKKLLFRLAGWE